MSTQADQAARLDRAEWSAAKIAQTLATASKTVAKSAISPCWRGLRRLGQGPNVGNDRPDLVFVEAPAESRHAGRLALLDPADDELVALVGAGELGTAAGRAAAGLMAPAARAELSGWLVGPLALAVPLAHERQ